MSAPEPYNEVVLARFENPVHAGNLDGDYAELLVADVSESETGARVVLFAGLDSGKIAALRYQVLGCPHLIAAAEIFCSETEGRDSRNLRPLDVSEYMRRLSVPIEKTGRMLLLDNAVRSLAERINR
jgi:NifU-like protein involved in Fe-S cluster formation